MNHSLRARCLGGCAVTPHATHFVCLLPQVFSPPDGAFTRRAILPTVVVARSHFLTRLGSSFPSHQCPITTNWAEWSLCALLASDDATCHCEFDCAGFRRFRNGILVTQEKISVWSKGVAGLTITPGRSILFRISISGCQPILTMHTNVREGAQLNALTRSNSECSEDSVIWGNLLTHMECASRIIHMAGKGFPARPDPPS